jgi:hypothetical protein
MLSSDVGPPRRETGDLGEPVTGPVWLEPWPDARDEPDANADPAGRFLERESVEPAFVAALQHLPATQRAVLVLREVLGFSAVETAAALATTPASVGSALQRARRTMDDRLPAVSQQQEPASLGSAAERELLAGFVTAWEDADVPALVGLLARDARFTMPQEPATPSRWICARSRLYQGMSTLTVSDIRSLDGFFEGPGSDVMVLPMDPSFDATTPSGSGQRRPWSSAGGRTTRSGASGRASPSPR